MKKILVMFLVFALVFSIAACQPNEEKAEEATEEKTEEMEVVYFRLAETHPADYPTNKGNLEFARLVKEKTNGRIIIEVYDSKQLGEEVDVIEQVQFGAIDFTRVSLGPLAEFAPELNVLSLPYIYASSDHMWKVLNSEIGDDMLASIYGDGFIGLGWFDGGARSFYNSVRPITKLEDIEGLKFRVMQNEMFIDMCEALGAVATPMPYGEVYSAIQTGVIDGAENNWPSYDTSSHFEVAKYYTLDEHLRVPEILVASKAIEDKVTAEELEMIKEAAKEAQSYQIGLWQAKEKESEEKIVEAGNEITYLSAEEKQKFADRMAPVYEKYASEYMDIIEKIQGMK
jgi:tripartite ATP-independent transporter DctP family solute receptor